MILGHLIPAGTGFKTHQEAELRINVPEMRAAGYDDGYAYPPAAEPAPAPAPLGSNGTPRVARCGIGAENSPAALDHSWSF